MAGYTAAQVKELRERTGAGMLDAKNALVDCDGDMEKAMEQLRQKGLATAAKKSGRQAAEGLVVAALSSNGQEGALVEVNCETDFVAKGDAFGELANGLAQQALNDKPADLDAFLNAPAAANPAQSVSEYVTEKIGQIKENLAARRFVTYTVQGTGLVHSYIHTGGKIGVLIELAAGNADNTAKDEFKQLAKDLSMQIASFGAEYVQMTDISQDVIDEETRIEMGKEDLQNKPEEIRGKIVDGRVKKVLAERVLLEQTYVKDSSLTVQAHLENVSKALGDTISVTRFTRFVLGEGIEKKEVNFAEEVMAQLK